MAEQPFLVPFFVHFPPLWVPAELLGKSHPLLGNVPDPEWELLRVVLPFGDRWGGQDSAAASVVFLQI